MTILHLTPHYAPDKGGVETHVEQISSESVKRGDKVMVLTMQRDLAWPRTEIWQQVKVFRFKPHSSSRLTKFAVVHKLLIWQAMAKQLPLLLEADVIQVHDVYWWLLPFLPLFWSKTYLTFHGWEGKFPVPWRNKLARWLWSQLALKTIHVGAYIKEFYWDQPDAVIYGGVPRQKKTLPKKISKKPQIVFIGRLEAVNELEKYLSLAQKLKSKLDANIIWVGDGAYRDRCQKLGQVTGMIKDTSLYLAKADLVWSASYLSILEAQAAGKIVCAFYSHQLKRRYLELYPGSKLMLVESRVSKMSWQIWQLLNSPPTMNQYAATAQKWAQQQTWAKVLDTYEKLWRMK